MPARLQERPRGTQQKRRSHPRSSRAFVPYQPMGLNFDHPPSELGPEVWSMGKGVLFRNDAAERARGDLTSTDACLFPPHYLLNNLVTPELYWIYASANGIGVYDGQNHSNITPAVGPPVAADTDAWTGDVINNLACLNNDGFAPWFWEGQPGNPMLPLPGWPANTTAHALRSFKYNLIAMNITNTAGHFGTQLLWSSSADPGSIPATWAPLPDNDAGDNTLAATPGDIVDGAALRESFIVCKQHSTYIMQYVGGQFVFIFRKQLVTSGVLSRNCMTEMLGHMLMLTDGDVVIFDGQNVKSILQDRMKRWLFSNIDGNSFQQSFVVPYQSQSEIWVCFPETGNDFPNIALVWDTNTDSWGVRDLYPASPHIARGIVPDAGVIVDWDGDAQEWDLDPTTWNQSPFNPTHDSLMQAYAEGSTLIEVDAAKQRFDGTTVPGFIGKESVSVDTAGNAKLIVAVWPRIYATEPLEVGVRIGVQMRYSDPIFFQPLQTFDPSVDLKVDVLATGRFLTVEFVTISDVVWRLDGFNIEVTKGGLY